MGVPMSLHINPLFSSKQKRSGLLIKVKEIICAQLCGIGHAQMVAFYSIVESEAFDKWVTDSSPVKASPEVASPEVASAE